jgi:hypothetical protein
MSPRVVSVLGLAVLLGTLAAAARGDEPKVYRWVGPDGRVYTSNAPPKDGKGLIEVKPAPAAKPARPQLPAVPASEAPAEGELCSRFQGYVNEWRDAQQSIESWEATIDRLESRTDNFVRRDDSAYNASIERANEHLDEARERASRVEAEGRAAGMPQSCLSE